MSNAPTPSLTLEDIRTVSPALERYTQGALLGDVWKRPGLAPRDRSVITLAALIARNQTVEMGHHVNLALDNGVKPGEISEIITHLAFYCGWSNALSAVALAKDVFVKRGIGADQLPPASDELLPLDEAAEAQRAAAVEQLVGSSVPGIVKYTTEVLFHDKMPWKKSEPMDQRREFAVKASGTLNFRALCQAYGSTQRRATSGGKGCCARAWKMGGESRWPRGSPK
jgi:alkylhydroperoxidase/carboxymuconolactone decarboxylase family protein YurZ